MNLPDKTDVKGLIEGCLKGDRRCQQKVYEMFYGKMMGVCLRYTKDRDEAKDVMQDGFIKVYNNLHHYNGNGSFEGWVRRIMVNTSIDFFRKNRNLNVTVDSDYVSEMEGERSEHESGDGIFDNIKTDDILIQVQKLSPAYRAVFSLYVLEGFTHKEIAEELGISVGTSKSNLAKAKLNLRKALNKVLSVQ